MWYVFLFGLTILMVEERLTLDQHEKYLLFGFSYTEEYCRFVHELPSSRQMQAYFYRKKKNPFYYLNLFALSIPPPHQNIGLIYYLYSYYSRLFRA